MKASPIPNDETLRLNTLFSYEILDSETEQDFDDLAELAAQVCNCEFALITFVDRDRQWFKATRNISLKETPRLNSFSSYIILQNDVMVVKEVKKEKRFIDSPMLTKGADIAFYAGAPIVSATGYKIGSVCAMDKHAKKKFTPEQCNMLKIIAHQVTALLELGIKNKLIAQQRDVLVAEEKKIVQLTLTGQEEEKSFIANELHENFAQTLAATKLYLDFAEQSKELSVHFIKKSKMNILQIIKDIKALSKSMLPSTYENANYLGFIQEMLDEYGQQNNKEIFFRHEGKLDLYDSKIGLTLFRIIQHQLKNAHNCGAKKINIKIKTGRSIRLDLWDDGKSEDGFEPERNMLLRHIETRIALVSGTANAGLDKYGHNMLSIEIPLAIDL